MKKNSTVAGYFAALSRPSRAALNKLRRTIRSAAPEATEVISYRMPSFKLGRMLVSYGAFRDHYSFFPLSSRLLDRYKRETARFRTSKGTLRFSFDEPLPSSLVKKIVKARVAENVSGMNPKKARRELWMPPTSHRHLKSSSGSAGAVTTKQQQTQSPLEAYHELSFYTLSLGDPTFIHQHIVDAYAAQYADETTKPMTLAFALIGLYLHREKDFTGREVQKAHMKLARTRKSWPSFDYPSERGTMTVFDVLRAKPGKSRDRAIERWSRSVWEAWKGNHARVAGLGQTEPGK